MEFATDHLRVRRIVPSDYDAMFDVYSDLELMRYVGDATAISPEDCARWIEITLNNYENRGYGLLLVEDRTAGNHVGFVGITHPGGQPEPEIKYVLRKEHWGMGLAQELLRGTCEHAHKVWQLEVLIATVHPENATSNYILQKLGFQPRADTFNEDGSRTLVWEHRIERVRPAPQP